MAGTGSQRLREVRKLGECGAQHGESAPEQGEEDRATHGRVAWHVVSELSCGEEGVTGVDGDGMWSQSLGTMRKASAQEKVTAETDRLVT